MRIPTESILGVMTITRVTDGYLVVTSCRDIEDRAQSDTVTVARGTRTEVERDVEGYLTRVERVAAVQEGKLFLFPSKKPSKVGLVPGVDA